MMDYAEIKQRTQALLLESGARAGRLGALAQARADRADGKKFKSNNDDYRKKYLSGDQEKRRKLRYKKAMEQFELWFGGFSSERAPSSARRVGRVR